MTLVTDESVRAATREVATALLPDLPSIGDGTAAYIEAAMPELAQLGVLDLVRASCHANTSALVDALMRGVPLDAMAPSVEVTQTTRAMVRHGLSPDDVTRGYQIGLRYWSGRWAGAVQRHCTDTSLALAVATHGTTFLLGWLQLVTDRLAAEYRDEAERLAREGSLARAADVRRALVEDDLDIDAASLRLGYDLSGRHVALVVSRHDNEDDVPLEATARALTDALTTSRPLVVRADVDTAWCWLPARDARELPAPPAAVLVGIGRPAAALDGFRRSHHEASEALRVAQLAGRRAGSVTSYDQVQLAALCSGDAAACSAFVAEQLGQLRADTDAARRLRATLDAFFDANSNFRATAARLGIHHNTVRYRLEQIERLLDRPIGRQRLHLELALHLSGRLDEAAGPGT